MSSSIDKKADPENPGRHGRFIDTRIAQLDGEAASQKTKQTIEEPLSGPSERLASDYPALPGGPTYYDQPVLQTPVWIWSVPAYFYVGGTAGAALVLASAAEWADGRALRGMIQKCRWTATAGIALGSVFLILDLGRPSRFLNMLRVFRPTSPLSVGSWLLTMSGPVAGGAAVLGAFPGPWKSLAGLLTHIGGFLGIPLAGYTGVVLADTAIPAWQEARRALPAAFIGSAMAGAASILEIMDLTPAEHRVVRRFGIVGKAAELAGTFAIEREASRVAQVGKPVREGLSGALWKASKVLSAASLLTTLLPLKSRRKHQVAGIVGSLGALGLRYAAMRVGRDSAADPRATFEQQRQGRGATEVTGRPAVTGPDGRRAIAPPVPERLPAAAEAPPRALTA